MQTEPNAIVQLKALFDRLDGNNVRSGIIADVYHSDMRFQDSFHCLQGREAFETYCESLYQNLSYCRFDYHDTIIDGQLAMLTWTMRYAHPRLKGGKEITVEGATRVEFDDKIRSHRDYFDGGKLLYEHVPILGTVIKTLKKRLG